MEQLIPHHCDSANLLAILLKKVEIKLNKHQLQTLSLLIRHYFSFSSGDTLGDQVVLLNLFNVFEKKIRLKDIPRRSSIKLKLDISQAAAIMVMLYNIKTEETSYERTVVDYITAEIDRQTC